MLSKEEVKKKLIVALDVDSLSEAQFWVKELKSYVGLFKVGLQLFTRYGSSAVRMVQDEGGEVFLDLKFHDIPNTVTAAIEAAVSLKVKILNVHALGGRTMMAEAVKSARATADKLHSPTPILLAVTILTSLLDSDLSEMGITAPVTAQVQRLAFLAYEAGLNGVVASPQEIPFIRDRLPRDFLIVTPGVRMHTAHKDDQKRVLTPNMALQAGADYIVIGRPILTASNPVEAVHTFLEAMAQAIT